MTGTNYEVPVAAKFKDQVIAKCNTGYTRKSGEATFVCGLQGKFQKNLLPLECVKDSGCTAKTVGNVELPKAAKVGEKSEGTCKTGFTKKAGVIADSFVCEASGAWGSNKNPIQCETAKTAPQNTATTAAACKEFTKDNYKVAEAAKAGDKKKGACVSPYIEKLATTSDEFVCEAGGKWKTNAKPPQCEKPSSNACAELAKDNYKVPKADKVGEKKDAACVSGYSLKSGTVQHECGSGGKWKPPAFPPVCEKIPSSQPCAAFAKDNYKAPVGLKKDAQVKAICDPGFIKHSGSDDFVCGDKGAWKPNAFPLVCKTQPCPGIKKNNYAVPDATKPGEVKTAKCDSGYKLSKGSVSFTCDVGAKWKTNSDPPVCIADGSKNPIPTVPPMPKEPTAADVLAANRNAIRAKRQAKVAQMKATQKKKMAEEHQKKLTEARKKLVPALEAQVKAQEELNRAAEAENKVAATVAGLESIHNLAKDPKAKAEAKAMLDKAKAELTAAKAVTAAAQKKVDAANLVAAAEQKATNNEIEKGKQLDAEAKAAEELAKKMDAAAKALAKRRDELAAKIPGVLGKPGGAVPGLSECCVMALRGGCIQTGNKIRCPKECGCVSSSWCTGNIPPYCFKPGGGNGANAETNPSSSNCPDQRQDCAALKTMRLCDRHPAVASGCRKSCSLCGCGKDKYDANKCWGWAVVGECAKNPIWMKSNCALSCCSSRPGGLTALPRPILNVLERSAPANGSEGCVDLGEGKHIFQSHKSTKYEYKKVYTVNIFKYL